MPFDPYSAAASLALKHWKLLALGLALVSVTTYAGVQKITINNLRVKVMDCKTALKSQGDKIKQLGVDRDRLLAELNRSSEDAAEILRASEKEVKALLEMQKANNCRDNLKRFIDQNRGRLWHGE